MDWRLRECDYGDFTQHTKEEVDAQKPNRIHTPFPNGESYEQTTARMQSFLEDLLRLHDNETVLAIGHRATQSGLEHLINNMALDTAVAAPWKWQPGWTYNLIKK
jgi:broad specificity phosphatase PhoE